jgi:hypothetical protein
MTSAMKPDRAVSDVAGNGLRPISASIEYFGGSGANRIGAGLGRRHEMRRFVSHGPQRPFQYE